MAEIRAADFVLVSEWRVGTVGNGVKEVIDGPHPAYQTVTFAYDLPTGAKVISAKVHADWGNPLNGLGTHTINGVTPGEDGMVDVEIDPEQGSISVLFTFIANTDTTSTGDRSARADVTEVYLLIETSGGIGYLYHAENGALVPYKFHRVESGVLVPYLLMCTLEPVVTTVSPFYTAGGETFCTADGKYYKVLGG